MNYNRVNFTVILGEELINILSKFFLIVLVNSFDDFFLIVRYIRIVFHFFSDKIPVYGSVLFEKKPKIKEIPRFVSSKHGSDFFRKYFGLRVMFDYRWW